MADPTETALSPDSAEAVLREAGVSFTYWHDHPSGRVKLTISIKGGPLGWVALEAHGRNYEEAVRRLQFVSEEIYR